MKFSKLFLLVPLLALLGNLSGCIPMMAMDLASQGAVKATANMQPRPPREMYLSAKLDKAVVVPYTAKGLLASKHPGCVYEGILTPYEQTWDEIDPTNHATNRRAQPGKLAGFVVVLLKMDCPGLPAQAVFRAGYQQQASVPILFGKHKGHYILWGFNLEGKALSEDGEVEYEAGHTFGSNAKQEAVFNYAYSASTHDMLHPDSDGIPRWLPQVMTKLVKLSATQPEIKADIKLAAPLIQQVEPELAPQLAALQ